MQSRIPASGRPGQVLGDAPVHSGVLFLLAVHGPQKKQRSGRQQHAMRLVIRRRGFHELAVLVPLDIRVRFALRLAIEGDRLVLRHYDVGGVFRDTRRPVLT